MLLSYKQHECIFPLGHMATSLHYDNAESNATFSALPKLQESDSKPEQKLLKPTILLVEDNALIQLCERKFCEKLNCHVVVASNALEALKLYRSFKPDLILLDVGLPHISGFDVCRMIRAQEKDTRIPIIAVTGFGDEVHKACKDAGMDDLIIKPLMPDQLKQLLIHWLPKFKNTIT